MKKNLINRKIYATLMLVMAAISFITLQSSAAWDDWRNSYATYTGSGYTGGAALLDPIPSTMEITALNPTDYNYNGVNAALAGAYLEVFGPNGNSTIIYVTDLYPEGADGALDLCPTSFAKIGEMAAGKIDIHWHVVKGPVNGNFYYRIKEGSSQWWAAIQVRNHKYPVMKMEYYKNGVWTNMTKMPYNHFLGENMGTDPLPVRITDIRGMAVTDTLPVLPSGGTSDAYIVEGNVQFPDEPGQGTPTPTGYATLTPTLSPTPVFITPTPTRRTATSTRRAITSTPTRRTITSTPTRRRVTPTPTRRNVTPTPTRMVNNTLTPRLNSTPTPTVTGGFVVAYVIQSDWGTGATISVTITNNTAVAVNGWTFAWTFSGNQTITNLWNATYTQSGASVSIKDGGFNATILPGGGSVNFGFNANYSGTNAQPTVFTLNGTVCQ